jgi:Zn-dependent peptidase ImmA (M78 family)
MLKGIRVKGTYYKIFFVDIKEKFDVECVVGYCFSDKKEIYVEKNLNKENKIKTLLHELFHALMHEISLDQVISSDNEQLIVDNFANATYEIFNNKNFKSL